MSLLQWWEDEANSMREVQRKPHAGVLGVLRHWAVAEKEKLFFRRNLRRLPQL
jgi:hypothetical protein